MSVPREWTDAIARLREAQVSGDIMRNPSTSQDMRDRATQAYTHAVDALVANLGRLSETHVLGQITMFLAKKERR
ncbi:MAG: hypothetical protein ACK4L4_19170 [Gemmobacter sp.]